MSPGGHFPLRVMTTLAAALILAPVTIGLAGTLLPAFGYFPALGGPTFSLDPWRQMLAAPELPGALRVTLVSGGLSTAISLALALLLAGHLHARTPGPIWRHLLLPLWAVPHVVLALGLAFTLAPSGLIARAISPWLTGWERPPDLPTVNDPLGLALALGLVVKETPFLTLAALALLDQLDLPRQTAIGRSLGYGPATVWLKLVVPQLYPRLRLPIYAVLAYGLSNVDMALVLGPTAPPPLAPLVLTWFADPDLAKRFPASAAALLQLIVVALGIALWHLGERTITACSSGWLTDGRRQAGMIASRIGTGVAASLVVGLGCIALLAIVMWSFVRAWRFPALLPAEPSLATWAARADDLWRLLAVTVGLGVVAALLSFVLAVALLKSEERDGQRRWGELLLYLPLLLPQVAFLGGLQPLLIRLGIDGSVAAVLWAHLLFVLPYTHLAMAGPFRRLDPRYARSARSLGRGPLAVLLRIELPLLLRPAGLALAIGFSVSVAQYLPTLFAGAGRVQTFPVELLGMVAGGNRPAIAVTGLTLALLPLAALTLAGLLPAWREKRRLRGGAVR